jgi:SOS-response transcriptional repressor LexA
LPKIELPLWGDAARARLHREARRFGTQDKLSAATGIPLPTLQKILKGSGDPGISRIALLARVLNCPVDYFLTGMGADSGDWETPLGEAPSGHTRIPLHETRVSAGGGHFGFDGNPKDYHSYPTEWLRTLGNPVEMHLLEVEGDSMIPELNEGDLVLVDIEQREPREAIFVIKLEDLLLVKRLRLKGGGEVDLVSVNPAYGPISVKLDRDDLIMGRVVYKWTRA